MTAAPLARDLADWPADVRLLRAAELVLAKVASVVCNEVRDALMPEFTELEAAALELSAEKGNYCRACGCTEFNACWNGCSWLSDDLCSSHAEDAPAMTVPS